MGAAEKLPEQAPFKDGETMAVDPPRPIKKVEEGEGPWLVSYADLMTLLMGFFALMTSMSTIDTKKVEEMRKTAVSSFGGELENPYEELAGDIQKFLESQKLQEKVQISVSLDGVQMTFQGTLFFDSGDFRVKSGAADLMTELARVINEKSDKYHFLFEGHTDSDPIRHPIIASNWELSGLRAARIAQIFEGQGFSKTSLTIIGWGENKPLFREIDEQGMPIDENKAKNRRVLIRVYDPKITNHPLRGE